MFSLTAKLDTSGLKPLGELTGKARLAAAKALTFTAKDAQTKLKADVAGDFHLRNRWIPQGLRIKPATSGDLQAQVGSIDKYMARHVVGAGEEKDAGKGLTIGTKRDANGRLASGGLLVMAYGSIGAYPTHTVVSRKLKRIDGQKRKTFQIFGRGGSVLIVRRTGKKRSPLEVLAALEPKVRIKERFDMFRSVSTIVVARFPSYFEAAIGKLQK